MEEKTGPEPKSILEDVEESKRFWVYNGPVVKNLNELYSAIQVMSDDTFAYHVNESKNDFHNWIRDVCKDERLANRLKNLKKKGEIAEAIKRRIEEASKKPKIKLKKERAIGVVKKAFKKRAIKEPERIRKEEKELPRTHSLIRERGHIIGGAVMAAVILFAVIGATNLPKEMITGAVTTELGGEGLTVASVCIFILIIVLAVFVAGKIKKKK